jgi:cytochrome c-type biogenesis protein
VEVSIFAAFFAGLISFISPCILPLIPMYLSFISGMSLDEMKSDINRKKILGKVIISSILFVLGFSFVFIALGASATFFGKFLLSKLSLFSKIAGVIIIILGLQIAGVFNLRFLNYQKKFNFNNKTLGFMGPFVAGLAFAFGWTPCFGPVLGTILIYSSSQDTLWQGILLLSIYSLGLAIPFLLTGIGINAFLGFLQRIKKYYKAIELVTGVFLIIMGVTMVMGSFTNVSNYIARWFPWLLNG